MAGLAAASRGAKHGATFVEHAVHSILNPPSATGMGWWSLNPYLGCEFGCTYCYARFAHRYAAERAGAASEDANTAFETHIFVKRRDMVIAALDRTLPRLKRSGAGGRTIVIGTATDPYQPAERKFGITRSVLQRLLLERDLTINITTKSRLVIADADVLAALQQRHRVSVNISLISADPALVRAFERRSPTPRARLGALARLTKAGITAGLFVAPVLPGITDDQAGLERLLRAARDAGAIFAQRSPLRLYPAIRDIFLPAVQRYRPALRARYLAAYGRAMQVPDAYRAALRERFARIAQRVGIPTTLPWEKDEPGHPEGRPGAPAQLDLL